MPFPILGTPKPQFFDSSGSPLASGTLTIQEPADDTNKASYPTYDDAVALTNANTNPLTLDSRGETTNGLWGLDGEDYKVVLKDSNGDIIWTVDDIMGSRHYQITAAEIAAGVTPTNYSYEPGNVLRYGANTTPGTTDMTTPIQNAIDSTADQNGVAYLPAGTYLLSASLNLKENTELIGSGLQQTVLKVGDAMNLPAITFSATNLNYTGCRIAHLRINGNKANQTDATLSRGIMLDNSTGTSSHKPRHIIEHVYVHSCKSDGIYMGAYMRSSVIHDSVIYLNDGYGIRVAGWSDSWIHDVDVGNNGKDGIYGNGAGQFRLHNSKVWTSLAGTGVYFKNTGAVITGVECQENYRQGFLLENTDDKVRGIILSGCVSDGDNQGAGGFAAIELKNIVGATIQATVNNNASGAGPTDEGIHLDDGCHSNNINITADDVGNRIVTGHGAAGNNIIANGRPMNFVTLSDDFLGDSLDARWGTAVGSDGQCVAAAVNVATLGKVRLVTGNDAGGTMALNGSQLHSALNWRANQYGLSIEFRVQMSAITDVAVFVGFTDQVASLEMPINSAASADTLTENATDACGIMFDTAMATDNWWLVGVDGGTGATAQNSAIAPIAGTYETWRITFANTGAAAFFRNGRVVGTTMSDAVDPTAALTPVVAAFSRGAASRNIDIDYIEVKQYRGDYVPDAFA